MAKARSDVRRSHHETTSANLPAQADEICSVLHRNAIPARGQPSPFEGITDSPAFRQVVQLMLTEPDSTPRSVTRRAHDLANALSLMRGMHLRHHGTLPIAVGKPDLDGWKERKTKAVTLLQQAAELLDGPRELSYLQSTFKRPPPGGEVELEKYLSTRSVDITKPTDVHGLIEHALLGQALRSLSRVIDDTAPEQMITALERVFCDMVSPLRVDSEGKSGGARRSQAAANRGVIVRTIDSHVPSWAEQRYALMARLAQIVDDKITRNDVRSLLKQRDRTLPSPKPPRLWMPRKQ